MRLKFLRKLKKRKEKGDFDRILTEESPLNIDPEWTQLLRNDKSSYKGDCGGP